MSHLSQVRTADLAAIPGALSCWLQTEPVHKPHHMWAPWSMPCPHTGSWGPAEVQGSHRGKGLAEEMSPGHPSQGRRGAEVMGASTGPDGLGREEAGQAGARP